MCKFWAWDEKRDRKRFDNGNRTRRSTRVDFYIFAARFVRKFTLKITRSIRHFEKISFETINNIWFLLRQKYTYKELLISVVITINIMSLLRFYNKGRHVCLRDATVDILSMRFHIIQRGVFAMSKSRSMIHFFVQWRISDRETYISTLHLAVQQDVGCRL